MITLFPDISNVLLHVYVIVKVLLHAVDTCEVDGLVPFCDIIVS